MGKSVTYEIYEHYSPKNNYHSAVPKLSHF